MLGCLFSCVLIHIILEILQSWLGLTQHHSAYTPAAIQVTVDGGKHHRDTLICLMLNSCLRSSCELLMFLVHLHSQCPRWVVYIFATQMTAKSTFCPNALFTHQILEIND